MTDIPFRDGMHIWRDAKQLGLPAYVVRGDRWDRLRLDAETTCVVAGTGVYRQEGGDDG